MKTAIKIALVVAATAFALNAMSQTGLEHQEYNNSMSLQKQFMTKYERGLVATYTNGVQAEADKMQRKAIKNGVAGLFFPVFLIPATVQLVRLTKCRVELHRRYNYYSKL